MQPGDVVAGRFEVEYLAGTGAFSTVYRARDRASGEAVALKVLLLGDPTPERFAREARVLGELQHPAIVPYVDHGETAAGERYLAMAWLDGEDLRRRISRGPMPVEAAGATIRRIAEALAAAHERGVVHRDVKPSNVYLPAGDGARATLVDFGVAHLIGAGGGLTRTGALVGTPAYMSPEQARGDGTLTSASDVFALGAVLYECVTGRPCFAATNMFRLLARIAFEPAPRASLIRPDLPGALDQLIAAMTERDPALRPSARAVAEALRDLDHDDAAGGGGETLTQREQRMVSIVVARRAGAEAQPAMAGEADDAHRTQALRPPGLGAAIIPAALREALQPLGVRLQALVDGSLVILVSGGQSATDLVARAARAALATREVVACEQIAIATGVAELDAGVALGPVFDRAAALLAARTGRIVIDEATADLLPGRFEVERDGPRDTPGEAAGARLLGEREAAPAARLLRGRPTPCVGRGHELTVIRGALAEAIDTPRARAVLVTGAAGVGKSRLRYEVLAGLTVASEDGEADGSRTPQVLLSRGDQIGAGSPYGMFTRAVRSALGIVDGEPPAARRSKLQYGVTRVIERDRRAVVGAFLGELLGTSFDDVAPVELEAARRDPQLMSEQLRAAGLSWLVALATRAPLLVVLEDVHWGDLPTIKLLDAALRVLADRPFVVLALARPELHDQFPGLWAEHDAIELRLGALRRGAAEQLVRVVLPEASPTRVARIIDAAGGNAFLLEELIRAAAERGDDDTDDLPAPSSARVILHGRLDALPEPARRVLRAGSVFGLTFWAGAVAHLVGAELAPEVPDLLAMLEARELVQRRPESSLADTHEYVFRHGLIHAAAYDALPAADRARGHRLAGDWLAGRGMSDALVLAQHFERGERGEQAARWYLAAAETALGGADLDRVVQLAERGRACGASGEVAASLWLVEADVHQWLTRPAQQAVAAERALAAFRPGSTGWLRALNTAAWAALCSGRSADAIAHARRACDTPLDADAPLHRIINLTEIVARIGESALADQLSAKVADADLDPLSLAFLRSAQAKRSLLAGDIGGAVELEEESARLFAHVGDERRFAVRLPNIGCMYNQLGLYAQGRDILLQGVERSLALGNLQSAMWSRQNLAFALAHLGELERAAQMIEIPMRHGAEQEYRDLEGFSASYAAMIARRRGDLASAEALARLAVARLSVVSPVLGAHGQTELATVLLAAGRPIEALAAAEAAMAVAAATDGLEEGDAQLRLVHAEALASLGRADEAASAIAAARDRLIGRADKIGSAERRAAFLTVEENRRTLDLAAAWRTIPPG
ncbi:MAG: protein kinase [Kofleriaceae bacterium]|nr:protein kinase [Kofleriaceae bacterium]MBP6837047.1 protein kinase [Kofleriaceae bacterium]